MRLLRERGQQHRRLATVDGLWKRRDGLPHQAAHTFCVEVFFMHSQITTRPGVAHHRREGRDHLGDKTLQAILRQGFEKFTAKTFMVLRLQHGDVSHQIWA